MPPFTALILLTVDCQQEGYQPVKNLFWKIPKASPSGNPTHPWAKPEQYASWWNTEHSRQYTYQHWRIREDIQMTAAGPSTYVTHKITLLKLGLLHINQPP